MKKTWPGRCRPSAGRNAARVLQAPKEPAAAHGNQLPGAGMSRRCRRGLKIISRGPFSVSNPNRKPREKPNLRQTSPAKQNRSSKTVKSHRKRPKPRHPNAAAITAAVGDRRPARKQQRVKRPPIRCPPGKPRLKRHHLANRHPVRPLPRKQVPGREPHANRLRQKSPEATVSSRDELSLRIVKSPIRHSGESRSPGEVRVGGPGSRSRPGWQPFYIYRYFLIVAVAHDLPFHQVNDFFGYIGSVVGDAFQVAGDQIQIDEGTGLLR